MHSSVISWYTLTFFATCMVLSIFGIQIYDKYYANESMEQRHERRMNEIVAARNETKEKEMIENVNNVDNNTANMSHSM